jgi:hypothetical protein
MEKRRAKKQASPYRDQLQNAVLTLELAQHLDLVLAFLLQLVLLLFVRTKETVVNHRNGFGFSFFLAVLNQLQTAFEGHLRPALVDHLVLVEVEQLRGLDLHRLEHRGRRLLRGDFLLVRHSGS